MTTHLRRRGFLAGTAGLLILPSARSAFGDPADERLNLAIVGDMYVAAHFFSSIHAYDGLNLVALGHPDGRKITPVFEGWRRRAEAGPAAKDANERKAAESYRRLLEDPPRVFADPRRMLDEMGDRIDAVVVSLFDHYHGVACGAAMRAGKHVFSERPLGRTIREARALRKLAAEKKVATSIRNPGNASGPFRRGLELIREGVLGPVEEVHVWFDRPGADRDGPPRGTPPVPDGLDWDLWLGPVAERPYHPDWMAYAQWRDFSNGGIGTFGPHAANLAFMALRVQDLWQPAAVGSPGGTIRVRAESARINRLSFPRWERVRWRVPARGDLPPVTFTWHHGPGFAPGAKALLREKLLERGAPDGEIDKLLGYAGALIIGRDGSLVTDDHNVKIVLLRPDKYRDVETDRPRTIPASRGHYNDWLIACRGGEPAWANFEYAGPLSEFLMLGNVATQFEGDLEYDPVAGQIVNHREADQALGYEYRQGWSL